LEAEAGLAEAALLLGTSEALAGARPHCEKILAYLASHPEQAGDAAVLAATGTVYRVFEAESDPSAQEVLANAQTVLRERANKITDSTLRESYLENVQAHRLILAGA